MKPHKKLLFLFLICIHFFPVFSATNDLNINGKYDFRESDLGEGNKTNNGTVIILNNLPATFSFVPEPMIYFQRDTTIANSTKAMAKIGEMKIVEITNECTAKDSQISSEQIKKIIGKPGYLHQLFMQANSYSSYNRQSNESVITYKDKEGQQVRVLVELVAICHGRNTYFVNLATKKWGDNNPAIVNSINYKNQLSVGSYVEFYLRTTADYDPNLILFGTNKAKLEKNNFRDFTKLSYRMGDYSNRRYETTGTGVTGSPFITSSMLTDGICYNALPDEVITPTWDFLLEPTILSQSLDPSDDYGQTVAYATIKPTQNFKNQSFSVIYSFDSLNNTGSNSFYMNNDKVQIAKIKYDLSFTPHKGYIEQGVEYIWHVDSPKDGKAELKVHNLATNAINALSGNWKDTIVITVKSTDNIYTSSN